MKPKGWKNPHPIYGFISSIEPLRERSNLEHAAFEAGADEYERCIWEMAKESPTGTFTFDSKVQQFTSRVLIGEE